MPSPAWHPSAQSVGPSAWGVSYPRYQPGPPTAVGSAVAFCGVDNKDEIRDFLASRRAKISPEQSGLPTFGENRRVPGLRREEVAMLSGVSVDYYTRLERDGRCA